MNLYQAYTSNPVTRTDPTGTRIIPNFEGWSIERLAAQEKTSKELIAKLTSVRNELLSALANYIRCLGTPDDPAAQATLDLVRSLSARIDIEQTILDLVEAQIDHRDPNKDKPPPYLLPLQPVGRPPPDGA